MAQQRDAGRETTRRFPEKSPLKVEERDRARRGGDGEEKPWRAMREDAGKCSVGAIRACFPKFMGGAVWEFGLYHVGYSSSV